MFCLSAIKAFDMGGDIGNYEQCLAYLPNKNMHKMKYLTM